ncbi:hypothetical protein [Dyadobacter sp. 3J3]|uniref:hypothetical protein n=1 Tax=Dyadobacter sp. 3J3 TaxID=2606600 RepID=UPI00135BDAF0|nr:hypothetical protein [Dyadobacter sp. 3J3]
MLQVRYRLSPDMIDTFDLYLKGGSIGYSFEAFDLINYLNTGYIFNGEENPTDSQVANFFKEVVFKKDVSSDNIELVRKMLPGFGQTDIFCSTILGDIEVGGMIDYVGFGKGFVFRAMKYYQIPSMLHSSCHWYMKALEQKGLTELNYVIISDGHVHVETYTPSTYDFGRLEDKLKLFRIFLEEYKDQITNQNIFNNGIGRIKEDSSANR